MCETGATVSYILLKSTTEINVTDWNLLFAELNAERLADIAKAEAKKPSPERIAQLHREMLAGLRDGSYVLLVPEDNGEDDVEYDDEDEGE